MAKIALIEPSGRVAVVRAASEIFDVQESLQWVSASDEVAADMRYTSATGFGVFPRDPPSNELGLRALHALLVRKGVISATDR